MFIEFNCNPKHKIVGDCVVRAIAKVEDKDWDDIFLSITATAFKMKDMPSSNAVWSRYLYIANYEKYLIPDRCPDCYTVRNFCDDHPEGSYILATGSHVIPVVNGDYYDTWDSGDEVPIYYFVKEYHLDE